MAGATGQKVDAHGDEFFGVFRAPGDAVGAAVTMQRAIAAYAWPEGVEVRVRSGIHSGRPELTDSGYVGLSVHTVARICAAAHGGQIVVIGGGSAGRPRTAPPGSGSAASGAIGWRGCPGP